MYKTKSWRKNMPNSAFSRTLVHFRDINDKMPHFRNNTAYLYNFNKRFLIWSSGGPPVQWSGTIYAILKEGIIGIIHVKLFEIWTSG